MKENGLQALFFLDAKVESSKFSFGHGRRPVGGREGAGEGQQHAY
jgi:hypothetical protein